MSTTLDNLRNFVTAIQADPAFVQTGRKESAFFLKMFEKRKTKGGANLELSVRNGDQATNAKWILPDDSSTDYIGTTSGKNDYQSLSPVVQLQFAWSFATSNLTYSDVQLQQAKTGGKSQLADYLGTRLEFSNGEILSMIGSGIIAGTGNGYQSTLASVTGSSGAQPYGIVYQDRFYSGTANANTNSEATNTHLGKARHLHSELVSNVIDDSTAYGTTVAVAGATLTNGSTAISVLTSADYSPYIGWEIWIDLTQSGSFTRLGREYVVADATSGAATTLQMSTVYRGATDTNVDIQLRAPLNATSHGAQGLVSTAKLDKAYYMASDGVETPDLALADMMTFAAIENLIKSTKQTILTRDADWEAKKYNNFMYNYATMLIDNNMTQGSVHFINTKYTNLYCLEGMQDYKIKGADIMELPQQTGFKQYGASKVFPFQIVSRSPRNNAVVKGLEV